MNKIKKRSIAVLLGVFLLLQGTALTNAAQRDMKKATFQDSIVYVAKGGEKALEYTRTQEDSTLKFSSANEKIATVDAAGKVHGVATGKTTIRVKETYESAWGTAESEDTIQVVVNDPSLSRQTVVCNIHDKSKSDGFYVFRNTTLKVNGINEDYSHVEQVSSKANVKVYHSPHGTSGEEFKIYVKQAGNYTVKLSLDGKIVSLNVKAANIYVPEHTKQASEYNEMLLLYRGETALLNLKGNTTGIQPTYKSSTPSVATVNNDGKVTAKAVGYTNLTIQIGDCKITHKVGVSYETSVDALRYAKKHHGENYSVKYRMRDGYYDNSSYVWRAYYDAGKKIGGSALDAATAKEMAEYCKDKDWVIMSGTVDMDRMLPGDIIFEYDNASNKFGSVSDVSLYQGNQYGITVQRNRYYKLKMDDVIIARPCRSGGYGLKTEKTAATEVKVSWSRNFASTGYQLYRSTSKTGAYTRVATVKGKLSYQNSGLTKGKTYYYKVRPYWSCDGRTYYGAYSSICNITL